MTTIRAQKAAKHRAAILDTARASFEAIGYEATTLRTITRQLGLSTGAIFAQFKSKDEIYAEVYGHKPLTPEEGRALAIAACSHGVRFVSLKNGDRIELRPILTGMKVAGLISTGQASIEEEDARSREEYAYRNDPSRRDEDDEQVQA